MLHPGSVRIDLQPDHLGHFQCKRHHSTWGNRNLRSIATNRDWKRRQPDFVGMVKCIAGRHLCMGQNASPALDNTEYGW
jgi:hypothetical protein